MNKPVDNRRERRITVRFLWVPPWITDETRGGRRFESHANRDLSTLGP
jgi:hypothetical protein